MKGYPTWEALLAVETNGWCVTVILRECTPKAQIFSWTAGPFDTKREALNLAARTRYRFRRDEARGEDYESTLIKVEVKPLWRGLT